MSKELKQPQIKPIRELPKFVQMMVADMWEKNGLKPEDVEKNRDIVVTYHDAIYTANPMPTDLFVHESVHFVRQGGGENELAAKDWCLRYCDDPEFRYEEELLAYREQYRFIKSKANRPVAFEHAKRLARDLSGPMYGNLCSFSKALAEITKQ